MKNIRLYLPPHSAEKGYRNMAPLTSVSCRSKGYIPMYYIFSHYPITQIFGCKITTFFCEYKGK